MKSFAFAVVFASSLLAISLAARCKLMDGAWKSDTDDLSSCNITEGIKVDLRHSITMVDCGPAAIKLCEDEIQILLQNYRNYFEKLDKQGVKLDDDYCRYFDLPQPTGWRFGVFREIEGCNVPTKFIGLLVDGEACCYNGKFGCKNE